MVYKLTNICGGPHLVWLCPLKFSFLLAAKNWWWDAEKDVVAVKSFFNAHCSRNAHSICFNDSLVQYFSGWWFGTFFIFAYIGNNHPNWLIFFRGVKKHQPVFFWNAHCSCVQKKQLYVENFEKPSLFFGISLFTRASTGQKSRILDFLQMFFQSSDKVQGLVNVPFWGLVSHHLPISVGDSIPNSWVMWNIRTFANPWSGVYLCNLCIS